jgi:hypothetical protein
MRSQCLALLSITLLHSTSADAQSQRWLCKHMHGDRGFKGANEVAVVRTGASIKVTGAPGSGLSANDDWTYRVVFETPGAGFRAARPDGGSTPFDALLGGELFLTTDDGKQTMLVTAVNAAKADMSFEIFSCKSAA